MKPFHFLKNAKNLTLQIIFTHMSVILFNSFICNKEKCSIELEALQSGTQILSGIGKNNHPSSSADPI